MPSIVVVMIISPTPEAECAVIECMIIDACIVAIFEVYTIVGSTIAMVIYGDTEVKVVAI